ncbi:MAG TPA: nuclear transport factor 2 family protein [Flavisolibacter sp.]
METSVATRSNLQIIQEGFADFAEGNIRGIIDLCADDVAWGGYKIPGVDLSGYFYGKEGVEDFFNRLSSEIDMTEFEPKEFIAQGDVVVVLGHEAGKVKVTGKTYEQDWCGVFRLKNGKVQSCFQFSDTYEFAKAFS